MYTSILLVALTAFAPTCEAAAVPSWSTDYTTALGQSARARKPLAVILAAGAKGWHKLSRDSGLSREAQRLMADNYVCLHIDTSTKKGKEMAAAFEMPTGLGIVISGQGGKVQAFRHEGDLADADLVRYLERYGDPEYVVRATESNPVERVSYYSPPAVSQSSYPSYYSSGCST